MMALLSGLWGRVAGWAIAAAGVLAVLAAAYAKGRGDQKSSQNNDRLKSIATAKEIENEVQDLGSNDIDIELKRWLRDK